MLVIEGGLTQNLSAKDLAELEFCAVAYPWTLVAGKLKNIRETLEALKKSMTEGAPPMILSYSEVCEGVGFNRYWVNLPSPRSQLKLMLHRMRKNDTSTAKTDS